MHRASTTYPQDFAWANIFATEENPLQHVSLSELTSLFKSGFEVHVDSNGKTWKAELPDHQNLQAITDMVLSYLAADDRDLFCMRLAEIDDYVFEMTVRDLVNDAVNYEGLDQYDQVADYITNHFASYLEDIVYDS